ADGALQSEARAGRLRSVLRRAVGIHERPADAAEVESAATAAAETAAASARVERAHHRREETRGRTGLDDRGIASRLDRARLLALERLVRRDLGELADIDLRQLLRAGDARPAGSRSVRH